MSKKQRSLCKWKSDHIWEDFDQLRKIVRKPKYVCRKCARSASKKKWLCKPTALK